MHTIALFSVFALGAIVGSFLNVVILRHGTGRTILGRSKCFSCASALTWIDLVPIVSFAMLRGRCRTCGSGISIQYPFVELLTGILFGAIYYETYALLDVSILLFAAAFSVTAAFFSTLVAIVAYDIKHTIIPDKFVALLAAFALASLFVGISGRLTLPSASDIIAGPALFLPFYALWRFSGGRFMGLGDGKLALAIGWFLGLSGGVTAIVLAFWIGGAASLIVLAFQKTSMFGSVRLLKIATPFTMKTEVPFGPFLALGTALQFFLNINLFAFM